MKRVKIPQATNTGYIECPEWGVFDYSYPSSIYRRGRVQGGGFLVPAIAANGAEFLMLILEIMEQEKETMLPNQGKARRSIVQFCKKIGEAEFRNLTPITIKERLEEDYSIEVIDAVMDEFDEVWERASHTPNEKKGWVMDWNNLKWFRIRKLTNRECFRLMDVSEEDIDKMMACGVSKSQLYKAAGNSIVVSCMYYIFKSAFGEKEEPQYEIGEQMSLF